jgi:hypothetical protein
MHIEELSIRFVDLPCLNDFLDNLDTFLQTELEKIDAKSKELTGDENRELLDDLEDKWWKLKEIFPNILRNAFFLACYSYYEYKERHLKKCLAPKIDFSVDESLKTELDHFKLIRNLIAHHGGRLDNTTKAQKVRAYISDRLDISVDEKIL